MYIVDYVNLTGSLPLNSSLAEDHINNNSCIKKLNLEISMISLL